MAEQRYKAVLAIISDGRTVTEVARDLGVSRQTLHAWLARYEEAGLEGLSNRSFRPIRWQLTGAMSKTMSKKARAKTSITEAIERWIYNRPPAGPGVAYEMCTWLIRSERTHNASPTPSRLVFLKPHPMAASTNAMKARIKRIVLKLMGSSIWRPPPGIKRPTVGLL